MTAEHHLPGPDTPEPHPGSSTTGRSTDGSGLSPGDVDPLAPVDSDAALLDRWRLLLRGEPFDTRTLWVTWYDERNVQLPVVVPIEELPHSPDTGMIDGFGPVVGDVLRAADGAWVSCALVRPGSAMLTSDDRAWADAVHTSLRANAVATRPLFLATAHRLRQLVLDDL